MAEKTVAIRLGAFVVDGALTVRVLDDRGSETPFTSLAAIVDEHGGADRVRMEIHDFYQDRTLYEVYGVALAEDGRTVVAHWEPVESETGVEYEFAASREEGAAGAVHAFVIGATPTRASVEEPEPFESDPPRVGGGLPIIEDPKKGGAGTNG